MRRIPIGVVMLAIALALWGGILLYQSSYAVAVGRADETEQSPQSEPGLGLTGAKLLGANCTDRKSVVQGKSVSVRVDLGGRRHIKRKITTHSNSDHIQQFRHEQRD